LGVRSWTESGTYGLAENLSTGGILILPLRSYRKDRGSKETSFVAGYEYPFRGS
jgi:hypothetical protein